MTKHTNACPATVDFHVPPAGMTVTANFSKTIESSVVIHLFSYGLQMLGIYTRTIEARVINLKLLGERAVVQDVRDPMS